MTNGNDTGPGSYRQAIADANAVGDPDTINFAAGLTVTLTSGDVTYTNTQPIVINGNGSTIDGSNAHQLLAALATSSVTVDDITMRNGDTADDGGAIETGGGDIIVNNSTFSGNTAGSRGGATSTLGGNYTITNSTLSGNTAGGAGGATFTLGGNHTITNSTFSGNTATTNDGGATRTVNGDYTITNSTFTSNTAGGAGGAIYTSSGAISLTDVTMSGNRAPTGAHVVGIDAPSSLVAFGSVLADPLGGGANCSIAGTTTSGGYNYSTDASCGFTGTGDTESGAAPQLGVLGNNGGPTQTMLPAAGSPLVEAIPVGACAPGIATDQRGFPRPADGNDDGSTGCDIGAVELQPAPTPAVPVAATPAFTG